jgi:hypothetical protein
MDDGVITIEKTKFWRAYEKYKVDSNLPEYIAHENFDNELGLFYNDELNDINANFYFFNIVDEKKLLLGKVKYGF